MSELKIGYARVSTDAQDLTAQREALHALGVDAERIYVDHGLTGTHRDRPGLRQALAACRVGDTLVVTKLDRLARSLPDARAIAGELTTSRPRAHRQRTRGAPRRHAFDRIPGGPSGPRRGLHRRGIAHWRRRRNCLSPG